jgi:hypothetical protein
MTHERRRDLADVPAALRRIIDPMPLGGMVLAATLVVACALRPGISVR